MTSLPIAISPGVVSLVKINDRVSVGQAIAKRSIKKDYVVNLVDQFSESPDKVRKTLRKKPGDSVNEGDLLAVKKNLFGFREEKILSRVAGVFSKYERDTGKIIIELGSSSGDEYTEIVSPVDGIVIMCDNEKIVIGTEKDVYLGRKGGRGSVIGEMHLLNSDVNEISLYYALDNNAVGKIVVGRNFPRDILIKCAGMGVSGVIGTEIRNEDLTYLSNRRMQLPIIEVDTDIIERITKWKSKKIFLNSQEKAIIVLHA